MKFGKEYDLGMIGGSFSFAIAVTVMAMQPVIKPTEIERNAAYLMATIILGCVYILKRVELNSENEAKQ